MYLYFKFFNFKKSCQLTLPERFLYSYLGYRSRLSRGATVTRLRQSLPLWDIKDSLSRLAGWGLLTENNGSYFANSPGTHLKDWFSWCHKGTESDDWTRNLRGFKLEVPTKVNPLTPAGQSLYFMLCDLDRQDATTCKSGLATLLNVTPKTVANNLDILERYKLIQLLPSDSKNLLYEILNRPEETEHWWVKAKPKQLKRYEAQLMELEGSGIRLSQRRKIKSLCKAMEKYFPVEKNEYGEHVPGGYDPCVSNRLDCAMIAHKHLLHDSPDAFGRAIIRDLVCLYYGRRKSVEDCKQLFQESRRMAAEQRGIVGRN